MIKDLINPEKSYTYRLILRNPNKQVIGCIPYSSLSFTNKFNDYNELNFSVNRMLYNQRTKENYELPFFDKIKTGQIVEMQIYDSETMTSNLIKKEYYIINSPSYNLSEDMSLEQNVSCIAAHQYWFNKMKIRGYESTRQLYNCILTEDGVPTEIYYPDAPSQPTSFVPTKITQGGILNYILEYILNEGLERNQITGKYDKYKPNEYWKVVYYDPKLLTISATVDISEADAVILFNQLSSLWLGSIEPAILNIYQICREIRKAIRTTREDQFLHEAYTNNWYEKADVYTTIFKGLTHNSENTLYSSINDIVKEPLLGSYLLKDLEQFLLETQSFAQDIINFKYIGDGEDNPVPQFLEAVKALSNLFLEPIDSSTKGILTSLAEVYQNATGSIPFRTLNLNCNLTEAFKQIEESYSCIFKFDNYNKDIYIYSRENKAINETKPLMLSLQNYITNISVERSVEQVITRLYPKGKDGLQIGGYNITGLNYTDNFDYFLTKPNVNIYLDETDAETLNQKVKEYQDILKDVQTYQDDYDGILEGTASYKLSDVANYNNYMLNNYLIYVQEWVCTTYSDYTLVTNVYTIKELQKHIVELSNTVAAVQPLAKSYIQGYYSMEETPEAIDAGSSKYKDGFIEITAEAIAATTTELNRIEQDFKTYVSSLDLDINSAQLIYNISKNEYNKGTENIGQSPYQTNTFYLQNNILLCQSTLIDWQKQFQYNHIISPRNKLRLFNKDDLKKLKEFVYVEEMDFSDIIDGRALYKYAQEYLSYINKIPVSFSLNLISLFDAVGSQLDWLNFMDVGTYIYINCEELDVHNEKMRLISYTHSISESGPSLSASFSNSFELKNAYNQVLQDIWAYSYKQIKDINTYRDSWQNFIEKQDALILQGNQIYSDVNGIVNKKGQTVVNSTGLKLSPAKHNMLTYTGNGYYVRRPTIKTTGDDIPSGSSTVKANSIDPETIEFTGGDLEYDAENNVLKVKGTGGNSSSLPWYYAVPIVSERIKAMLTSNTAAHIVSEENTYVYYQELKDTTYTWYRQQIDTEQVVEATDENNNVLYWSADGQTLSYKGTEENIVKIYVAIGEPEVLLRAYRNSTTGAEHLPIIKFGIGDGEGHGYGYVEKVNDGIKVYYYTRSGSGKDTLNRNRGIYIKDNGVYQIRGNNLSYMPFIHYQDSNNISTYGSDWETDDWVLVDG